MTSSSKPPEAVPATVRQQLGGGVQTAVLHSHGLQEAHREARDAARAAGDDRPLVLVVPAPGTGDTLYVVQSCRLADLIAAGTCEGAHIVRLTRRLVRNQLETKDPTHGLDLDHSHATPAPSASASGEPERADDWAF